VGGEIHFCVISQRKTRKKKCSLAPKPFSSKPSKTTRKGVLNKKIMLSAICLFKLDLFYSVVWKKAKTIWKERVLLKNLWWAGGRSYRLYTLITTENAR